MKFLWRTKRRLCLPRFGFCAQHLTSDTSTAGDYNFAVLCSASFIVRSLTSMKYLRYSGPLALSSPKLTHSKLPFRSTLQQHDTPTHIHHGYSLDTMAVATPKKTTFMVMSDTHNFEMGSADPSCPLRQPHAKVDVLLHCGDLTQVGGLSAYKKALRLLGHFEAELKLVIAGNHDISLDGDYWQTHLDEDNDPDEHQQAVDIMTGPLAKAAGVTYLTEGTHNITLKSGVTFSIYVSPYQPVCGDWAFGYERTKDRYSVKPAKGTMSTSQHPIPRDVDIVMTHGPPHGVLDLIPSKNERARCEALGNAMQRVRPLMHCFGHIHEGYGAQLRQWSDDEAYGSAATARQAKIWALGETESHHQITPDAETLMINAAIMDDGGKPTHSPWVVELELRGCGVEVQVRAAKHLHPRPRHKTECHCIAFQRMEASWPQRAGAHRVAEAGQLSAANSI